MCRSVRASGTGVQVRMLSHEPGEAGVSSSGGWSVGLLTPVFPTTCILFTFPPNTYLGSSQAQGLCPSLTPEPTPKPDPESPSMMEKPGEVEGGQLTGAREGLAAATLSCSPGGVGLGPAPRQTGPEF